MEKINIAELLRDCPKGMELDCTMFDNVKLVGVDEICITPFSIKVSRGDGLTMALTKYGQYADADFAKCVIFPKGKTTWEGFQRPFKDGDVVTCEGGGVLVACIYKERKNTATFNHHIAVYEGDFGIAINGEIFLTDDELCLATEDEKEKLFKAIKDNGYKWNPETKTLEKLVEPKFKVGDRIKQKKDYISGIITDIGDGTYKVEYKSGGVAYANIEFQDDWELVPNKFDITTLKAFDMNEDFAPYELAVKLKEKGFPQHITDDAYIIDNYGEEEYDIGERLPIPLVPDYMADVAAPTISQVLKWLREKKKIHLIVEISDSGWYYTYYSNIRWRGDRLKSDKYYTSFKTNSSYELAIIAGIEYVLDNLI